MHTLHLISHTHWDREWYLTFQQFRLKLVQLIDCSLDILEQDKDYKHFMLDGQTIVLDDYLFMRPEREAILREHIRKGRILVGPWHILPDEFLVSPEATIRNLLQGERTALEFGPKMKVGYIPDPFGHIGQMPQILQGFGIEVAALRRGLADEPCEVWWEAPDGSRVFTAYLRDGYDNAAGLPTSDPERFVSEVRRLRDSLVPHSIASDYLLMHGTDHMQPPPDTARAIKASRGKLDGDRLIHSTLTAYFDAVQKKLKNKEIPTVRGELRSPKKHHLLPGVLSTRMWIKQRNQACETLLEKWAEPFSTFAELTTEDGTRTIVHPKPSIIRHAWRLLMENHPHDSICGCSIDQVHDEMRPRFDQVEQIGEEITRQSLETLAEVINTRVSDSTRQRGAIVVFNPGAGPRTDLVTTELDLPSDVAGFEITNESGAVIPHQQLGSGTNELINISLDRAGLAGIIGSLHEGRAANLAIQDFTYKREENVLSIQAVMAENAEPNQLAWERCLEAIKSHLNDPTISTFHIRACSVETAHIAFVAPQVPGHGWRAFSVHGKPAHDLAPTRINRLARIFLPIAIRLTQSALSQRWLARLSEPASRPPYHIENEFFVVEVARDGTLTVTDKRDGTVTRGLNRFVDGGDCGDEYNYCPPPDDPQQTPRFKSLRVRRGLVQQSLEIKLELKPPAELAPNRKSRGRQVVQLPITTLVSLLPGVPRVDIHTEIDNRAKDHRLRVHFPMPFSVDHAQHDGHFEVLRRPIGVPAFNETWVEDPRPEVPQRVFTDVSDGQRGLMIVNRGLPEVEVLKTVGGSEIGITLLRCVGWLSRDDFSNRKGHAGPFLPTPAAQMIGKRTFDYSIIPHSDGWENAFEQAYSFEVPMRAVSTSIHAGTLPIIGSFIQVSPRTFVISAVKQTEDSRGWLVRGYNITSEEIKVTFKPWRKFKHVAQVNLAEQKMNTLVPVEDGSVNFVSQGHEIVSMMFRE